MMKRLGYAAAFLMALGAIAWAQTVSMPPPAGTQVMLCTYQSATQTLTSGSPGFLQCDVNGNLKTASGTGTAADQIQGNVASGSSDIGNPVKTGGVYNTTPPTFANGQRGDSQIDVNGNLNVIPKLIGINPSDGVVSSSTNFGRAGTSASDNVGKYQLGASVYFNGTSWDRMRGDTNGIYAVQTPTSSSNNSIGATVSGSLASNAVLKSGAGNLYGLQVTSATPAGFVMIFDATAAPADGAVAPRYCQVIASNSTVNMDFQTMPSAFLVGITAVFSTTGCFFKAASATAFFSGMVK